MNMTLMGLSLRVNDVKAVLHPFKLSQSLVNKGSFSL